MHTKKTLIILLVILFPLTGFSQYEKMLEALEDETEMMESGKMVLRFVNAENGMPVDSADISIEGVGKFVTNKSGKAYIEPPADKTYALTFSKKGFITATYPLEIVARTAFSNKFSVSPSLEFGYLRVVLDWGRSPADLDAHLVKEGGYHISYQNMKLSDDGIARLDRDDRKGYGPETITVKSIDDRATYTYFVKNYTDRNARKSRSLSKSAATVRIYGDNKLLNTFTIRPEQRGTSWMVFTIVNGKVTKVDEVGNQY